MKRQLVPVYGCSGTLQLVISPYFSKYLLIVSGMAHVRTKERRRSPLEVLEANPLTKIFLCKRRGKEHSEKERQKASLVRGS